MIADHCLAKRPAQGSNAPRWCIRLRMAHRSSFPVQAFGVVVVPFSVPLVAIGQVAERLGGTRVVVDHCLGPRTVLGRLSTLKRTTIAR